MNRTENRRRPEPAPGSLRGRIETGDVVRGLLSDVAHPTLIELCGHAGLDFACLDFEHGSVTDTAAENAARAAESVKIPLLARVRLEEMPRAARFLDAGGAGIIVAHVSNAAEVHVAVQALLIPPLGRRGVGASRISRLGFQATDADWATQQNANLTLGMQIEDGEGVSNASEIASHPDVSLILVGTRDLSFDLGVPGQYSDPRVKSALKAIRSSSEGKAAMGLMVRNLASDELVSAQVLLMGLGAVMRFAATRLGQIT